MGERKGEKCDFRWYQTKEKNVTVSPLPPDLSLPSSMLVPLLRSEMH